MSVPSPDPTIPKSSHVHKSQALETPFSGAFTGFLWRLRRETEPVTPVGNESLSENCTSLIRSRLLLIYSHGVMIQG